MLDEIYSIDLGANGSFYLAGFSEKIKLQEDFVKKRSETGGTARKICVGKPLLQLRKDERRKKIF